MRVDDLDSQQPVRKSCCPCGHPAGAAHSGTTRREFLASAGWRNWGGMQTEEDVRAEVARIRAELDQLKAKADFPLDFLSLATVRRPEELAAHNDDINAADVLLFYAGGDGGGNLMAFLLEQVFRGLMARTDCRAMTINGCMGTIMPMAETTACLTLSLLNDAGYLAFCESDFVVIPAGILLGCISDRPVFLNDPTYPHDGIITLAHCTAPRRMSGEKPDPARIMTHFESDYGAAPKVEMPVGQTVTNLVPDFKAERWTGLLARIEAAPLLPICRSQIDVRYDCSDEVLARHMPGFHWITGYGDHLREVGYALKQVSIQWDCLG